MVTHALAAEQPAILAGRRAPGAPGQPGALRRSNAARSRATGEFTKFVAVGVAATAVSTSLYNVFAHTTALGQGSLTQQPVAAFVLANLAGMVVSFFGTQWWAFSGRTSTGPARGLPAFVVINVASWIIPLSSLAFSRYVLGLSSALADNVAANVVGLGLGTIARFWALRATTSAKQHAAVSEPPSVANRSQPGNALDVPRLPAGALAALPSQADPLRWTTIQRARRGPRTRCGSGGSVRQRDEQVAARHGGRHQGRCVSHDQLTQRRRADEGPPSAPPASPAGGIVTDVRGSSSNNGKRGHGGARGHQDR